MIWLAAGPVPAASVEAEGFVEWFSGKPGKAWYISNFVIQHPSFVTAWRRYGVRALPKGVDLKLHPDPKEEKPFAGAEIQRRGLFHHGRYEVVMRPARGSGIVSAFFTYTGPSFGTPHDEIDIEFLGRDTTKIWLNRFVEGRKLPGQWIDLGFDAAEAPRLYSFDWHEDGITWAVEGRELLRIDAKDHDIPTLPQKIFLNIWAGNPSQAPWTGPTPADAAGRAHYLCVSFQPAGQPAGVTGAQCSDDWQAGKDDR